MENRRRIRRFTAKIIIIFLFNILFSNAYYQITKLPSNGLGLSSNLIYKEHNNYNINLIKYPANIYYCNFKKNNKYFLSFLNYGTIEDQQNQDIFYSSTAYELYFKFKYIKELKNGYIIDLLPGIIYSKITGYNSLALLTNIKVSSNSYKNNIVSFFSINNVGLILKKYSINTEYPAIELHGCINKQYNQYLQLEYNLKYDYGIRLIEHIVTMNKKISHDLSLIISISSNKSKLLINNTVNDLLAGSSIGVLIKNDNIDINLGIFHLGPAGYAHGISCFFK